jgi:aspartate carbamoyltransferase, regulatory subunit
MMSTEVKGKELIVSKIRDGIVIDHIPVGRALMVLRVLRLRGGEGRIALVMNVESRRLGRKDIVKIEGKELGDDELNLISLIAPTATINVIKDYAVVKKFQVKLPDVVKGVVKCRNPRCITNQPREDAVATFKVIRSDQPLLQCLYCGTYLTIDDINAQLAGER